MKDDILVRANGGMTIRIFHLQRWVELAIFEAHYELPRIDRICMREVAGPDNVEYLCFYGSPSPTPSVPALAPGYTSLATIVIPGGVTSIVDGYIKEDR